MTHAIDLPVQEQSWSTGCDKCRLGLVIVPDELLAMPLYVQRAYEAANGLIVFCDCRAGNMYRQHLRKVYRRILDTDARVAQGIEPGKLNHGDEMIPEAWKLELLAHVQRCQDAAAADRVPTIHYEKQPA